MDLNKFLLLSACLGAAYVVARAKPASLPRITTLAGRALIGA